MRLFLTMTQHFAAHSVEPFLPQPICKLTTPLLSPAPAPAPEQFPTKPWDLARWGRSTPLTCLRASGCDPSCHTHTHTRTHTCYSGGDPDLVCSQHCSESLTSTLVPRTCPGPGVGHQRHKTWVKASAGCSGTTDNGLALAPP